MIAAVAEVALTCSGTPASDPNHNYDAHCCLTCRCENDPRKFPAAPMHRNITYNSPVRYECGPSTDWYAANYYCTQNIDEDALFPVLGGCRYDYPLGDCLQQPVVAGVSRGCAAEVDVLMSARISGTASDVIGIAFVVSDLSSLVHYRLQC